MSVNETKSERSPVTVVVALAGLVIISAGMRAFASVLVPVLIAAFLAILLAPSVQALLKRNWPKGLAVVTTILGTVIVAFLLTALVGDSLVRFSRQVPEYATGVQGIKDDIFAWLSQRGIGRDLEGGVLDSAIDTSRLLALIRDVLGGVANLAGKGVIILLLAAFALLEMDRRQDVFEAALGKQTTVLATLRHYSTQVVQYLKVKTWMSAGTGLAIGLSLWLLGVDYPVLWGVLAFLLNFVPAVGSLIAAIPPILLALLQYGVGRAIGVVGAVLVVNIVFSNIIEPKVMGRSFGISPVTVLVALLYWAWVFGPVGMILAIPLTVALKIALEGNERTTWIAGLM